MKQFFILLLFCIAVGSPAQITFQRYLGTNSIEYALSGKPVSSGGYILASQSDSIPNHFFDVCIVRTDDYGNILWKKYFGSAGFDLITAVVEVSNGFVFCGGWNGLGNDSALILKTDLNGNLQWIRKFRPNSSRAVAQDLTQTSDGGFAVTGFFGPGFTEDMFLYKFDSGGVELWHRVYTGSGRDEGFSVNEVNGNGFILGGQTSSSGNGGGDMWLVRTDASGIFQWGKTYGTANTEVGYDACLNSDGGFSIVGYGDFPGGDVYLARTDANGDTLWTRRYDGGGRDQAYGVEQTPDGGFAVAARSESQLNYNQAWMIRTDGAGGMLWNYTFPSGYLSTLYDVQLTPDGGFFLTGERADSVNFTRNIYIIKTGSNGQVGLDELSVNTETDWNVYPVPASDFLNLNFSAALPGRKIRILDMEGRLVMEHEAEDSRLSVNIAALRDGIYLLELVSGQKRSAQRIVIAH